MSSAHAERAVRPGVSQGPYPERRDEPSPPLARALHAAVGLLRVPRRVRRAEVAEFAATVDAAASGLADLSEGAFERAIEALRVDLSRAGLQETLVPRGFAVVREAARRSLGTPHYDVQLFGGFVMARNGLAELETGEGKTLTATLPAALAALAAIPVHVITANDYLVERDAESMAPLFARLGLSIGTVVEAEPERPTRRAAYACDVTYVTHKQVAFDYLQDRLAVANSRQLAHRLVDGVEADRGAVLRGLCFAIVDEADSVLIDDARTPLILSRPGADPDERTVRTALWLSRSLDADVDYRLDRRRARVEISGAGKARLADLAGSLEGPLASRRQREEWVHRALSADHLFERDRHYLVQDDAIQIIDLPTGRRAPDRCFEGGVHSLIEAKERLALSPDRETVARISYQRFFRRYLRLAGMTGTAKEVAQELWKVYDLGTTTIPTRLPSRRSAGGLRVFADSDTRWQAVVERIRSLRAGHQPVLVGTCSVAASENLSGRLSEAGVPHEVLNARQDREEAQIVAQAGEAGRVTVATRMAGRGTDIRLGPGVEAAGGLAVVATELGDAGRIDRQLFGRCARQGAPGCHEQLVSLEDPLLENHVPEWLRRVLGWSLFPHRLRVTFTKQARKVEERRSALARRRMLESERMIEELLAFSGRME